eukprot:scaffold495_cov405-Prasinococcus_capsulatus_cf.AAC.6
MATSPRTSTTTGSLAVIAHATVAVAGSAPSPACPAGKQWPPSDGARLAQVRGGRPRRAARPSPCPPRPRQAGPRRFDASPRHARARARVRTSAGEAATARCRRETDGSERDRAPGPRGVSRRVTAAHQDDDDDAVGRDAPNAHPNDCQLRPRGRAS